MENKYNIMITYGGDGDFRFTVKRIGEITITKTKPVYIYNVDANVINNLRELRRLLLEITIGAKPDGAFKVYNFDDYADIRRPMTNKIKESDALSNSDISSILKGAKEPEIIDVLETVETDEIVEEPEETVEEIIEEPVVEEPKEEVKKPSTTKKKSSKKKSNKKK